MPTKVVQKWARHRTIAQTMDVYAEVFPVDLVDGISHLSWASGDAHPFFAALGGRPRCFLKRREK